MMIVSNASQVNTSTVFSNKYSQVNTKYVASHEVLWSYIHQKEMIPCFSMSLLTDLFNHHEDIALSNGVITENEQTQRIRYSVLASKTPGYFNMGGDLEKMAEAIRIQDRKSLETYAKLSIDVVAQRIFRFNIPRLTTISLLQGETLGAGIEAAITSDILIAERQSILCFPEMFFNMFPGMGAYSLIGRKAGLDIADKMILGCARFTAEECHEMGLVDIVADEGQGERAVYDFIDQQRKRSEGYISTLKAKKFINPITHEELNNIVGEWVENALSLNERDLKVMARFFRAQQGLFKVSDNTQSNVVTPLNRKITANLDKGQELAMNG
jgi:DSF synthase